LHFSGKNSSACGGRTRWRCLAEAAGQWQEKGPSKNQQNGPSWA
jgi:hypothetical protein